MRGLTLDYVVRRLFMYVLTIWLGATIIFFIPRLVPGDPVTAMITRMMFMSGYVEGAADMIKVWRARFGLDDPLYIQYFKYMGSLLTLNLGYSLSNFPVTVADLVKRGLPWTVGLLSAAVTTSFLIGTTIGALLGWRRTPKIVKRLLPLSMTFTSIPFFMLAMLLIFVFAFGLRWFPVTGAYGRGLDHSFNWPFIQSIIHHAILPITSIVMASMGFWALGMRGMMITADGEDYLLLAQAKGLSPGRIFFRYSVRNAILPQVTALALSMGGIVGGSTLVEYLFAYPGMGYLLYQGIVNTDYTVISGVCFILILTTATAVLIIDLIYPLIDPRITYQKR